MIFFKRRKQWKIHIKITFLNNDMVVLCRDSVMSEPSFSNIRDQFFWRVDEGEDILNEVGFEASILRIVYVCKYEIKVPEEAIVEIKE